MRVPIPLAVAAFLAVTSCVSPESTLREARDLVERVRPSIHLEDVRIVVWNSAADAEAASSGTPEYLSLPYVQRVLLAHAHDFERLGMKRALEILAERRLSTDAPDMPAFVVPSASTIVIPLVGGRAVTALLTPQTSPGLIMTSRRSRPRSSCSTSKACRRRRHRGRALVGSAFPATSRRQPSRSAVSPQENGHRRAIVRPELRGANVRRDAPRFAIDHGRRTDRDEWSATATAHSTRSSG